MRAATGRAARRLALAGLALLVAVTGGCGWERAAGAESPSLRIPLRVERAEGVREPAGLPVTVGVPLPEGAVTEPAGLALRTVDGRPVPAQMEVRARHPHTGHVRWLGVDFALEPDVVGYELVAADVPAPAGDALRITERDDALLVDTGRLRVEIPRRGGLLRRAWLDGVLVLDQPVTNELVRLGDGARFTDGVGPAASGAATVETAGPLHAVVRVEGRYAANSGETVCRWTARLHFHAGQPLVRIAHTFVWIGSAEALQIRELGLRFDLAAPGERAWADRSGRPGDGAHAVSLQPGGVLSLLQDQLWHWGHGESRFAVRAGPAGALRRLGEGERAGSWIAVANDRVGVSVALRDLWQLYPKELRATPRGVVAGLWSSAGAAPPLDLRIPALERWWGPGLVDQLRSHRWQGRYQQIQEPEHHDPTGMARTHDVLLRFFRAPDGAEPLAPPPGLEAWADAFDREPRVVPDPAWTVATGELGLLGARDPGHPELEEMIDRVWLDVSALVEDWGDHGFLGHGGGPHFEYRLVDGRAVPSPWRYGASTGYGYAKAAWWAYLRSGDRRLFELARAHSRFLNDLVIAHASSRSRRRGDWHWTPDGTVLPWEGTGRRVSEDDPRPIWLGHRRGFGFFIEHAVLAYAVTGDRWALDVAREYKDALLSWIDEQPEWPQRYVDELIRNHSRWAFQRLDELASLYLQFGDPALLESARALADALLDPSRPSGVRHEPERRGAAPSPAPSYLFYKGPGLASALRAFDGERRVRVRAALLAMARHDVRTRSLETRSVGLRMAHGLDAGGEPGMLAFASKRAAERRRVVTTEPTGRHGYRTRLSAVPAVAYNTITNEGHLVRALEAHGPPAAPFPAVWKARGRPAADLVLEKEAGVALTAALSVQGGRFLGPDGDPWPERWWGEATEHAVRQQAEPWRYREVRIPAEAPPGPYRIRVQTDAGGQVLTTDTRRRGLVAPGGLDLGSGADRPWYFEVPAGTPAFGLWASDEKDVEVRDAAGDLVHLPRMDATPARIEAGEGRAARAWSARALETADLALFGVPPVFAYGDPAHLPDVEAQPTATPVARAVKPTSGFAAGRTGQGVRLVRREALVVRAADGDALPVDPRQGTVEFLLRPDWNAARLPHATFRGILGVTGERGGRLEILYGHDVTSRDHKPFWDVRVHLLPAQGPVRRFWVLRNTESLQWSPDRWVHIAWVWHTETDEKEKRTQRVWSVFIDGDHNAKRMDMAQPLDAVLPGGLRTIEIGGPARRLADALEGTVDDVRISSVARYGARGGATMAVPDSLPVDDATLAVFRLDGSLRAAGPTGSAFAAAVRPAPR